MAIHNDLDLALLNESTYAYISYDETKQVIFHEYKENTTADMKEDDYKTELSTFLEKCLETRAKSVVGLTQNFEFAISPELQEWTDKNIFAGHKFLKKCAVLVSEDLIAQLGLEQVLDEDDDSLVSIAFETKFFSKFDDALSWAEE